MSSLIQSKPVPPSVATKPIEQTKSKPAISQTTPTANSRHPKGSRLIEVVNGVKVGTRGPHSVSILDMTGDTTQVFPYLDHCDTCAWEGRFTKLENAKLNAIGHAGR